MPGAGWIGQDPTSGLFATEGHLPLAATPEPSSAAPVTSAIDECEVRFSHLNRVNRFHESPRATLPYTEGQWARIDALGVAVDAELAAGDARLTQGGKPTFVSVTDMDAPEWTVALDESNKRELASGLAQRFAPGGLLQFGPGKWYPGEVLPRWQIGVLWRADGEPLWRRSGLLADPWAPGESSDDDALWLTLAIAAQLGIPPECCLPPTRIPWTGWRPRRNCPRGRHPTTTSTRPTRRWPILECGPGSWRSSTPRSALRKAG